MGLRTQLGKIESGTAESLPLLVQTLSGMMETLAKTKTWRELRAPDKREFVKFRSQLQEIAKTGKVPADAEAEVHFVLDSVKQTLERAGLTMADLVSVTIYCTDLDLYDKFNVIYRSYFQDHYPSRAFIGVAKLVRGARFEIAGVAVKPAKSR